MKRHEYEIVARIEIFQPDEKARIHVFNQLLILAAGNAVIQAILAAVGYYGIVLFK